MTDRCPTCGHPVEVVSSDEGTSYYRPIEAEAAPSRDALAEALRTKTEEWLSNVDATDSFEHALTLRECAEQVTAILAALPTPRDPLDVERLTEALHDARDGTCAMPTGGPDDWDCKGVAVDTSAEYARLADTEPPNQWERADGTCGVCHGRNGNHDWEKDHIVAVADTEPPK